jgi:AraC-like DNA-binding protein
MNYITHLFQFKLSKTDIGNTIKTFSETKQHRAIENILPIESVHTTTQKEFGKDAYQLLLNVLQGMSEGSVLTLSVKESVDKETGLVVQHHTDTEGGSQSAPSAYSPLDEPFMANVYNYIAKNIEKEDLTIDDLTHECAMSRSQLFRKIKAVADKTPAQLIRDFRLDTAHRLFQSDKTKRVSEVMFAVGFNDAKHFGQIFKQRFGVSPQVMKR